LDDSFQTVHRNLGIGYFNKTGDQEKAVQSFEKAFSLDPSDARVFMELDQLYKRTGKPPAERLELLNEYPKLVDFRDDLYLEKVSLYNFLRENEKAYKLLMDRKFHPWEGGEGKVSGQYVYSLTELAKQNIEESNYIKAVELLEAAQSYPQNLGEGKLFGTRENDLFYWMGIAFEKMGEDERAVHFFRKATEGDYEPEPAIFYNDQSPEMIFYQGLAHKRLNEEREATGHFQKLIQYGKEHRDDEVTIDYFAVSLPDLLIFDADLQKRNRIHCSYMEALGYFGLNQLRRAEELFESILEQEPMHFGAKTHQTLLKSHLQLFT
jgi:tetratricopeptide (TPR) repeat protein